ncbi:MAG TPA: Mrp/NBP35 family ATP-binding protein [Myxococcota bacterium]|nr:Mrp/NBP35 family ATP-binding protein [Myxococcota bacterium]
MANEDPRRYLEPAATKVRDPLSNRSVWLAGMVSDASIEGDTLSFTLDFSKDHERDDRARIVEALKSNLAGAGWQGSIASSVRVEGVRRGGGRPPRPASDDKVPGMSGPGMHAHGGPVQLSPIPGVKHIVAVASGKGGVGKSTVATNLAVGLAAKGHLVGLLDADIYGPSLPLMMNVQGKPVADADRKIVPLMAYGVKCMSIGFLADPGQAIIWRGPMVMGAVRQFLQDVAWAPVDYLVIDLPPGTGDAQLTMIQNVPIAGAIIVTTPQEVALLDARRGVQMFRRLDVPVLGVVENMSWLELPGGDRMHPFGEGGGPSIAAEFGVELLGQVPLDPAIRAGGDSGSPAALEEGPVADVFKNIATLIDAQLGR